MLDAIVQLAANFHFMKEIVMLKYWDIVFLINGTYVWAEYYARMHTPIKVRYSIHLFNSEPVVGQGKPYKKLGSIAESNWKETPLECRQQLADTCEIRINKDQIVWEESFAITLSLIDENF